MAAPISAPMSILYLLLITASSVYSQIPAGCPQPGDPPPPGGVPPGCPPPPPTNNGPLCGTTPDASMFSIAASGSFWQIQSNGCPDYDWRGQKSPARGAVQQTLNFKVPRNPILQSGTGTFVGTSHPVLGPIGIAFNAVALFSPVDALGRDALLFEGWTFDNCGGHVAPGPNIYHYHITPGDTAPGTHNNTENEDFTLCPELAALVGGSGVGHSPMFGILYDGIPIYGPRGDNGQLPLDLDACNGHVDASFPYYHYHSTSNYPYLVNCLKGCVDQSTGNKNFGNVPCIPADVQYDYSTVVTQFPRAALAAAVYDAPGTCYDVTGPFTPLNQCFNNQGSQYLCCDGACGNSKDSPACQTGYIFPTPTAATAAPVGQPTDANGTCDPASGFPHQCYNAHGSASICCQGQCPSPPSDEASC